MKPLYIAFCNRVEKESKHCQFQCQGPECTAGAIAVRDQIIIGILNEEIREEALKNSWDLTCLRKEGMRLESASKSASEISGDARINKIYGKYSRKNPKMLNPKVEAKHTDKGKRTITCYFCGLAGGKQDILIHAKKCPARSSVCSTCNATGHYAKVCRKEKKEQEINGVETNEHEDIYNINLFRINTAQDNITNDFKVELLINNNLGTVLADTGAKISVCSLKNSRQWKISDRMTTTSIKIKPYKSKPIPVIGVSTCSVTFGDRTVPVQWHIIEEPCETVLSGLKASQLGIVKFQPKPEILKPINMIKIEDNGLKKYLQRTIVSKPEVFTGIGKLKGHVIKLPINNNIKAVAEPPRRIPYHLKSRVEEVINDMIKQDVIEELPTGEQAPWTSNLVIAPKDDGDIRVTLDAKNLNKALLSSNFPIPRQEDIKSNFTGKKVFSKLDLKSAFWQLEIAEGARNLTVFHANGKLYRYKRLVMGLKPSQGELNAALQPLFSHLPEVHVIHDDIVIATDDEESHVRIIDEVLHILSDNGLTLNQKKCVFGARKIKFWGLMVSDEGISPDPEKVEALKYLTAPQSREELISFLCMMQSNADFIEGFSETASVLRELTKKETKFRWEERHESCFNELLNSFREDVSLHYFDPSLRTFIFVDGHVTGLGAILSQGTTMEDAKPVAIASRSTSASEKNYPQLDLEAASLDFGLRRFREYVVGSPTLIKVITDHKPLVHIFNGRRNGSIRTQRIKLNHQDVPYIVEYRKGSANQADYASRRARDKSTLPIDQQKECNELNNLLYTLHTTQIIDHLGIARIAKETSKDTTLSEIQKCIKTGKKIGTRSDNKVKKFKPILEDMTITGNGILLKDDRIVLPESLQGLAIELAHRGSHPGRSGIERRLRFHFFFHEMYEKVGKYVQNCKECAMFVDKKTKEPIRHHKVPRKTWETVAVDLFGPMPSSKHVVVVQDLGSRYPAAKLVASTKADKVIPVLEEIYSEYGNPKVQISDNGPPFNCIKMKQFTDNHDITQRFSTPYFPSQNPAETFMKTIGKTMKINQHSKISETKALREALTTYRQTPHPATGIPPSNMMFRDGIRSGFPRKQLSDDDIEEARRIDENEKKFRQEKINASKYRKESPIVPGDVVLVRNMTRKSKFEPIFCPNTYVVLERNEESKNLWLKDIESSKVILRHLDDVKSFHIAQATASTEKYSSGDHQDSLEAELVAQQAVLDDEPANSEDKSIEDDTGNSNNPVPIENIPNIPRRPSRLRKTIRRYIEEI